MQATEISGTVVNKLKLANAPIQKDAPSMGLKLMGCLFSDKDLVNRNPSGLTKSKNEHRVQSIQRLDSTRMSYIESK